MDFYTWLTEEAESNNNLEDSDVNSSMIIHISHVNTYRSAVSSLFRIIFGFSPADSYQAKLLAKAFNKSHPKHPRFEDAWDVSIILSYFNVQKPPKISDWSILKSLQAKIAVLISFFTLLRPSEVSLLSLQDCKELSDGYQFFIVTKTNKEQKTSIFVPELKEHPYICPFSADKQLISRNKVEIQQANWYRDSSNLININTSHLFY
jgi:hypothetical protein